MSKRTVVVGLFAVVVLALLTASSTQAWSTRVNHLTFNKAVRLPGIVLTPGTYTFEAGPLGSDPDVVRVMTRRGDKQLFLGFTTEISRSAAGSPVSLGEAQTGAPQPITVWWYGPTKGRQFRY